MDPTGDMRDPTGSMGKGFGPDSVYARNNWLSAKLNLGNPTMVSRNLSRYRSQHQADDPTWAALTGTFST